MSVVSRSNPQAFQPRPLSRALHEAVPAVSADTFERMNNYIDAHWTLLRRHNVSPETLCDEKTGNQPFVYCPDGVSPALPAGVLRRSLHQADPPGLPGLLYVPEDFVVPGGRFNEQYGWDTYFTVRGLLADGHVALARGMVDNLLFEVERYGKVLNANRSYYLGRSSPPFLTSAVLSVFKRTGDKAWLAHALPLLEQEHASWMDVGPSGHQTKNGLARYASDIGKPCPEVEAGYYIGRPTTPEFYRHDRAERESGWDMTDRFNYRCMDYNPCDLNALLCREESDIAAIIRTLHGDHDPQAAAWDQAARERRQRIDQLMWNEQRGMYFDFDHASGQMSDYASLATFVPLWAGIATPEQARRVADNIHLFEMAGGLSTSCKVSGKQWDAPYGWPPLQMLAVEGLRNYGYEDIARRLEAKFIRTVAQSFERDGTIKEKYNMADATARIDVGYGNQEGFGWTNAAVRTFCQHLVAGSQISG